MAAMLDQLVPWSLSPERDSKVEEEEGRHSGEGEHAAGVCDRRELSQALVTMPPSTSFCVLFFLP